MKEQHNLTHPQTNQPSQQEGKEAVEQCEQEPLKIGDTFTFEHLNVNGTNIGKLIHISRRKPKYGFSFDGSGVVYVDGSFLEPPVSKESLQGETVEQASKNEYPYFIGNMYNNNVASHDKQMDDLRQAFKVGAQWQSQHTATELAEKETIIQRLEDLILIGVADRNEKDKALAESQARVNELEAILSQCGNAFRQIQRDELLTPSSEALISKMLN